MAQLLKWFLFFSQGLLQLDEHDTVGSIVPQNKKIVTLLMPASLLQSRKGKSVNMNRRGTSLYTNDNHCHVCTVFNEFNFVQDDRL